MKVEVMKERDKGFICLIKVMICGKFVASQKTVSHCSGRDMQKNCFLKECSFRSNFYEEKVVLNKISL